MIIRITKKKELPWRTAASFAGEIIKAAGRYPAEVGTHLTRATISDKSKFEDWDAPEYTDIFSQDKVDFRKRYDLARMLARVKYERVFQATIEMLEKEIKPEFETTGLNPTKIIQIIRALDPDNMNNVSIFIDRIGASQLLTSVVNEQAHYEDQTLFNPDDHFLLDSFYKFANRFFPWVKFRVINSIGVSLPYDFDESFVLCFAWNRKAVEFDITNEELTFDWVPKQKEEPWLVNHRFSVGTRIADMSGIIGFKVFFEDGYIPTIGNTPVFERR